jgi:hypothetical protein
VYLLIKILTTNLFQKKQFLSLIFASKQYRFETKTLPHHATVYATEYPVSSDGVYQRFFEYP